MDQRVKISPSSDWRWQIKNSIKSIERLIEKLPVDDYRKADLIKDFATLPLPFSVTPYFVSLMNGEKDCPIFSQVIPSMRELIDDEIGRIDPLGEENLKTVPHLVHRYPDRVLFLATDRCATYCRFCTRKRWVGQGPTPARDEQEEAFKYIENNSEIKEIIFSGGDPLLLSDQRINELLQRAFSISSIDVVRFHSRMLSFAPMRVDAGLCEVFQAFSPIYLVTHFNHPKEITKDAIAAIARLQRCGVIVLNQSVLLKNINDDEKTLIQLFRTLIKHRVRPYYLHQCDVVTGAKHFRVPLARAAELMKNLRGHISGLCLPTLVIDIPGGLGKVPLPLDFQVSDEGHFIYLEGFRGEIGKYPKM